MKSERGFGLVEVLVGAGIASAVSLSIMGGMNYLLKQQKVIGKRNDIETIRTGILTRIDCTRTFAGVTMPGDCTGLVATRPRLIIRDKFNNPVTSTATLIPSGKFAGSAPYSQFFYAMAYCDQASSSLVVRIAKGDGTNFLPSPTDHTQDWDFGFPPATIPPTTPLPPLPPLFGESSLPLCSSQFGGAPTIIGCTSGNYMEGINLTTLTAVCKPLPPPTPPIPTTVAACPTGQYAKSVSSSPAGVSVTCADFGTLFQVHYSYPTKISTNADGTALWNSNISCATGEYAISGGGRCPGGHTTAIRPSATGNTNANQPNYPGSGPLKSSNETGWIHNCVTAQDLTNEPNYAICIAPQ